MSVLNVISTRTNTILNIERESNGHFVKGKSANPEGRPVGSKNYTTLAVEKLIEILYDRLDEAKKLDFKEFLQSAVRLLPKKSHIDLKTDGKIEVTIKDAENES